MLSFWSLLSFAVALVVCAVLPGLIALWLLRVRWSRAEMLCAAPALSVTLVVAVAYGLMVVHLRTTPLTVLPGVAALLALLGWSQRRFSLPRAQVVTPVESWLVLLIPVLVYLLLEPIRRDCLLWPTPHDNAHHVTWFRLIYETGSLDSNLFASAYPAEMGRRYPWGMHVLAAQIARLSHGDALEIYNRCLTCIAALCPLSLFVLAGRVLKRGWPQVAAAFLLIAFWYVPFQPIGFGGYPLLLGAGCIPVLVVLGLEALERPTPPLVGTAVVSGLGLVFVHPSQAEAALLVLALLAAVLGFERRLPLRLALLPLGGVLAFYLGLGLVPKLWPPLGRFLAITGGIADHSPKREFWFWYKLIFSEWTMATLCVLGGLAALAERRYWPLLAVQLGLAGMRALGDRKSWLTVLFYHQDERLWYLQFLTVPLFMTLGLWRLVRLFDPASTDERDTRWPTWRSLAWPAAFVCIAYSSPVLWKEPHDHLARFVRESCIVDAAAPADFAWIRANIGKKEVLLNAPGDYGLVLAATGRIAVFSSLSETKASWLFGAVTDLDNYDQARHAAVKATGIRYLYAAKRSREFHGRMPLYNLELLSRNRGWQAIYDSPAARIFQIRDQL